MTTRARTSPLITVSLLATAIAACANGLGTGSGPGNGDVPSGDPSSGDLPPPRQPDWTGDASSLNLGNRGHDAGGVTVDASPRSAGDAAPPPFDAGVPPPDDASPPPPPDDSGVGTLPDTNAPPPDDASQPPPPVDSGTVVPTGACPTPLGAGDLAIVELMIASELGSPDQGEWLEVQSTRGCSLNLNGLHVESPRSDGTGPDTLDVTTDLWIPANGLFVVADSLDPASNNQLPTPVVLGWNGSPADVLDDPGDTVTLSSGGATVDLLTYPAFVLYPGESISFPADCTWADRSSWARWSYSANYWTPGFQGTPNTDNTDVTCY